MSQIHARTERLIGKDGLEKLKGARVAVFGLGGVGGAAAWALGRCGVGMLRLIDCDEVAESNLNRQMIADLETIGMRKTEAAEKMIRRFNADSVAQKCFCSRSSDSSREKAFTSPSLTQQFNRRSRQSSNAGV